MARAAKPSSSRRRLLTAAWSLAGASLFAPPLAQRVWAQRFSQYPFTLGVASGCPRPDGIVLWTRLAPDPIAADAMATTAVPVRWELARDESFRDIVKQGSALAAPELAHSVHVELRGLDPARHYWYRFATTDAQSPVGRTRTAPARQADSQRLRFAFASCQHFEQGYFGAYRHMAAEDVDLVVFLGDYIYESSWGREHVRKHDGPEPTTLEDYRSRHALYKTDMDLQHMHASVPWIFTWDDHEVDNDYAADQSERLEVDFVQRRAAAYQAYYEHMPLERSMLPHGPNMRIYARFEFGKLALFHVLDDRQYRHAQACPRPKRGGGSNTVHDDACPERNTPNRSLLGREQEHWLHAGLARSQARWNILAQQTLMAQLDKKPGPGSAHWTDGWDGYPVARRRLLEFMAERMPSNPLVIGGDVHSHWVCDLKPDFNRAHSPVVASEFCGTSITSQAWPQQRNLALLPDNPHVKFVNSERRGYVLMELSPRRCIARLRGLENEKQRDSGIVTQASFVVENGHPGAQPA
jgi:alkaline phosphatase D